MQQRETVKALAQCHDCQGWFDLVHVCPYCQRIICQGCALQVQVLGWETWIVGTTRWETMTMWCCVPCAVLEEIAGDATDN